MCFIRRILVIIACVFTLALGAEVEARGTTQAVQAQFGVVGGKLKNFFRRGSGWQPSPLLKAVVSMLAAVHILGMSYTESLANDPLANSNRQATITVSGYEGEELVFPTQDTTRLNLEATKGSFILNPEVIRQLATVLAERSTGEHNGDLFLERLLRYWRKNLDSERYKALRTAVDALFLAVEKGQLEKLHGTDGRTYYGHHAEQIELIKQPLASLNFAEIAGSINAAVGGEDNIDPEFNRFSRLLAWSVLEAYANLGYVQVTIDEDSGLAIMVDSYLYSEVADSSGKQAHKVHDNYQYLVGARLIENFNSLIFVYDVAMTRAIAHGDYGVVRALLEYGMKGSSVYFALEHDLTEAARQGNFWNIVELLNKTDPYLHTAQQQELSSKDKQIERGLIVVELLTNREKYLNEALYKASAAGEDEIAALLIKIGATDLNHAADLASWQGRIETVKLLVAAGATDLNASLFNSVFLRNNPIRDYLLTLDSIDLNEGLRGAVWRRDLPQMKFFTELGANDFDGILLKLAKNYNWWLSNRHTNGSIVTFLNEKGSDLNHALLAAIKSRDIRAHGIEDIAGEVIRALVSAGADDLAGAEKAIAEMYREKDGVILPENLAKIANNIEELRAIFAEVAPSKPTTFTK